MGTNDNRDRKLLHYEKAIWRKAFEESMKHTSIEGATRNAWKAVDACYRTGLFHEEHPADQSDSPTPILATYKEAWKRLAIRIGECGEPQNDWESRLCKSMNDFALGKIGINDFQEDLEEIFPEECD